MNTSNSLLYSFQRYRISDQLVIVDETSGRQVVERREYFKSTSKGWLVSKLF